VLRAKVTASMATQSLKELAAIIMIYFCLALTGRSVS